MNDEKKGTSFAEAKSEGFDVKILRSIAQEAGSERAWTSAIRCSTSTFTQLRPAPAQKAQAAE